MLSGIRQRLPSLPGELTRWQSVVFAVFILAGLVVALAVPLGGGFDEIQHMRRAWEMSAWDFIPNSKLGSEMAVPNVLLELSYREQPIVRAVGLDYWRRHAGLHLDSLGWTRDRAATRSIYSPPLLLPQSLVLRYMGRKYDMSLLSIVLGMRLSGLLVYAFLAYMSVRLIPFGKWTMAVLAALPTSLFQASTISADSISNGLALLFIAGTLRLSRRPRLDGRGAASLVLLCSLLFLAKANLLPLLLLALILLRTKSFSSVRLFWLTWGAILALFLLEAVGWNLIAYPSEGIMISPAPPSAHVAHLLGHPLQVAGSLIRDLAINGGDYLAGWIAAYGYFYWPVPLLSRGFFLVALLLSLVSAEDEIFPGGRTRWALALAWLASYAATTILLQVINVDPGSGEVREIQGRYLTGAMPLLLLSLVGLWRPIKVGQEMVSGLSVVLGTAAFALGAVLAYRVPCGPSYYNLGTCLMPRYKNYAPWDHPTPPVSELLTLRQEILVECDGLSELRLWANGGAATGGSTLFQLRNRAQSRPILDEVIPNVSLPKGDWMELGFEPQPDSKGRLYVLSIRGQGGDGSGPTFGQTVRPEYFDGRLFQGGEAVGQDLFFQYGCTPRLQNVLTP